MQTPREISENRAMHGIAVALLTEDQEHYLRCKTVWKRHAWDRRCSATFGFPRARPTPFCGNCRTRGPKL